jgi:hypothetical protein
LWTKVLDGLDFDIGYCIKQTADSGFIIAGSVMEPLPGQGLTEEGLLLRTDVDGNYLWAKKYVNATTKFSKVSIDSNGDFIVAGRTTGSDSDLVILKMNSFGNIIWQHYFAISGNDDAYDLGFTGDGYVLVGNNQTLQGKQIVIIKTDLSGTNSCLNYNPNIIADTVTYSDKAFIQQIVIDTTGSNLNGIISNSGTGQLSSYCLNTNINEEEFHHFNIYPNPASSFIFLKNESLDSKSKFQIVNLMGQIVFEESLLDQNTISISVKELPNGIYNIINIDSNSKSISKLIVQHE